MKRYKLDFMTNENGIKIFMEDKTKLVMYDIPKINKDYIINKLEDKNFSNTGIYLLISKNKKNIYVGESDNIFKKVLEHIQKKQKIFDRCIFVFSDSIHSKMNKDQIRYVEKKVVCHFKSLKSWNSDFNKEKWKNIDLLDIDKIQLDKYFDFILYGMKLFDYEIYYSYENEEVIKNQIENDPISYIDVRATSFLGKNIEAKFIQNGRKGKIFMAKGYEFDSRLRNWNESNYHAFTSSLNKFKKEGKIDYDDPINYYNKNIKIKVIRDSKFTPSGIGTLVHGGVINGWRKWFDNLNRKIDYYRKQQDNQK